MIRKLTIAVLITLCVGVLASPIEATPKYPGYGTVVAPPGNATFEPIRTISEWWSSGYVFQRLVTVSVDLGNGCKLKSAELRRYNLAGDHIVVVGTTPVEVCTP